MPYIPKSKRKYFDTLMHPDLEITHPGSLNYAFTKMLIAYTYRKKGWSDEVLDELYGVLLCCLLELDRRQGKAPESILKYPKEESYSNFNNYIGNQFRNILNRSKSKTYAHRPILHDYNKIFDFYKEIVSPYEDKKIKENGDVYE